MEVSKDNEHFRGSGRRAVGEMMGVLRAPHSQGHLPTAHLGAGTVLLMPFQSRLSGGCRPKPCACVALLTGVW